MISMIGLTRWSSRWTANRAVTLANLTNTYPFPLFHVEQNR